MSATYKIRQILLEGSLFDRRTKLHDISVKKAGLTQKSKIIQFYSGYDNIGNYTPVLGIQDLINFKADVWNVHKRPIDFDFINSHYRGVIIGGAGLFHKVFQGFWKEIERECKIPIVIWGLGGCFVNSDKSPCVSKDVVTALTSRCDFINVRDYLTADFYNFKNAHISPCPTVVYLKRWRLTPGRRYVLHASHTELVDQSKENDIHTTIKKITPFCWYTDNIQRRYFGLQDIISRRYAHARVVVTTRLHGAIIAYGLGIPYIILSFDEKLQAFHQDWGGGWVATSADEIGSLLKSNDRPDYSKRPQGFERNFEFAGQIRSWIKALAI